ncbi:MAG TPA: transglutaminase family protein [Acetobacteraceae bacterium]|nr:transglutaminase family protein [Acetobacteraceae bacterium]
MIYRVRHLTSYEYQAPVALSAHLAHLLPRQLPVQRVLSARVTATPAASWRRDRRDHFGNDVTWLFFDTAHANLAVTGEAVVDVSFPDPPPPETTLPWDSLRVTARRGGPDAWQPAEFLFDSPLAPADAAAAAYAAPSFPPGRPALSALLELNARIRRDFTFRPGVTTTSTTIPEVLSRREGVCQDFAHLMIGALRGLGVPARYVSGYIRTRAPTDGVRRLGADQSHAWVGCWLGPEHGWIDLDPTNGLVVKEEHVVLGWGRDFRDVTPLRGVILGGPEHELSVRVELEPQQMVA